MTFFTFFFSGYDAIFCAAWQGNAPILESMMEQLQQMGQSVPIAEVFSPGPLNRNAFHAAAIKGHYTCIQSLIGHLTIRDVSSNRLIFR